MTQEEKQLLINDLCARLRYGVKGFVDGFGTVSLRGCANYVADDVAIEHDGDLSWIEVNNFKPYLRPMSSMTEEELKELNDKYGNIAYFFIQGPPYYHGLQAQHSDIGSIEISEFSEIYNWLNEHHFDYRKAPDGKTMIEAGLAIEALEDMYN